MTIRGLDNGGKYNRAIKPGGRIALILPKAFLSGVSWQDSRNLINQNYVMEYIFASQDPERWNFSDSTDLSETMVIARRRTNGEKVSDSNRATIINLWHNPTNTLEALAVANILKRNDAPDLQSGQGALDIMVGDKKFGEAISVKWNDLQSDWMLPATFAQSDLIRVGYHLTQGDVWLPGYGKVGQIPLRPLATFAKTGPDGRDVYDGFNPVNTVTSYPALWGHKSNEIRSIKQQPNKYLAPLAKAKPSRPFRRTEALWPKSSRVLIGDRIRFNTNRMVAIRVEKPVLSNVWWPLLLKPDYAGEENEKIFTLWFNSTII